MGVYFLKFLSRMKTKPHQGHPKTFKTQGKKNSLDFFFQCKFKFNFKIWDSGIFSNSLHPGVIITNIQRHFPERVKGLIENYKLKTIEQGAATTVWAATADELDGKGGLYLEDCGIGEETNDLEKIKETKSGYRSFIMDKTRSDKLWDLSEKLIKRN